MGAQEKTYSKLQEEAKSPVEDSSKSKTGVLNDINFEVNRGELCCIVGSVGSGKSRFFFVLFIYFFIHFTKNFFF